MRLNVLKACLALCLVVALVLLVVPEGRMLRKTSNPRSLVSSLLIRKGRFRRQRFQNSTPR